MTSTVEIIEDIASLHSFKNEWDALYLNSYNKTNVFLTFEWIIAWAEISAQKIFVIVVRNEEKRVVLIAPLAIRKKKKMGMKYKILTFLAYGPTDYHGIIAAELNDELVDAFLLAIQGRRKNWDTIELQEIGKNDILSEYLLKSKLFNFVHTNSGPCPRIILGENEKFSEKLAKKTRLDVNYQIRRLNKGGELQFKTIADLSELESFMTNFFEIHKLRWNSTKTPSKLNDIEGQQIFRKLAEGMFVNGSASYHYLVYNNQVVACNLGFESGNTFYYYLIANHPAYSRNSIGKVYISLLLENCYNNNIRVFDFLRGTENYKNDWGTTIQRNRQFTYTKSDFKGFVKWMDINYVKNDASVIYKLIKYIQRK